MELYLLYSKISSYSLNMLLDIYYRIHVFFIIVFSNPELFKVIKTTILNLVIEFLRQEILQQYQI